MEFAVAFINSTASAGKPFLGPGLRCIKRPDASNRNNQCLVDFIERRISMYQHILVPVDGSPTSNAGLAEAIKIAKLTGGTLRLVHVVDELPLVMSAGDFGAGSRDVFTILREAGEKVLAEARKEVERSGVAVEQVLIDTLNNRLSDHVAKQASDWPADLIVIGTHGRRGVGRMLLGSGAEQVLRHAPVPVLLVRGALPGAGNQ